MKIWTKCMKYSSCIGKLFILTCPFLFMYSWHLLSFQRRKSEQKFQAVSDNGKSLEELVNISKMLSDVKKLQNQVKEAGIISGGGTFQWVDSILVKVSSL